MTPASAGGSSAPWWRCAPAGSSAPRRARPGPPGPAHRTQGPAGLALVLLILPTEPKALPAPTAAQPPRSRTRTAPRVRLGGRLHLVMTPASAGGSSAPWWRCAPAGSSGRRRVRPGPPDPGCRAQGPAGLALVLLILPTEPKALPAPTVAQPPRSRTAPRVRLGGRLHLVTVPEVLPADRRRRGGVAPRRVRAAGAGLALVLLILAAVPKALPAPTVAQPPRSRTKTAPRVRPGGRLHLVTAPTAPPPHHVHTRRNPAGK